MKCLEYQRLGVGHEAIAICHHRLSGLCAAHLREISDPVLIREPICKTVALPLRRAGIQPYAWVINQSFSGNGFRDPGLAERGIHEVPFLTEVREQHAPQTAPIPWKPEAPIGPERFGELARSAKLPEPGTNQIQR